MGLEEEIEYISLHDRMVIYPAGITFNIEYFIRKIDNIQGIV
jgi:hypothetical protein